MIEIYEIMLKTVAASLVGGLLGWTRAGGSKVIGGPRTFALVCLGAATYTLISETAYTHVIGFDPSRIAAQIVTGVGFIGAGIIWKQEKTIVGLTTAAGIWLSAALGIAIALDLWAITAMSFSLAFVIFKIKPLLRKLNM